MNAHTSLWLAIPLALMIPVGAIGCNNGNTGAETSEPEAVATAPAAEVAEGATPTAAAAHRGKHHARGMTHMFFHAAKSLDLDATQTATIEGLRTQLHADASTMRAPQQALHAALVAGVQAGKIDLDRIAPLQTAVTAAHQAHQAREAAALNGLWSALQPAQRTALVAAIREKQSERAERWAAKNEAATEGSWQTRRLSHLTTELSLDSGQQATVAAINAKTPAEVEERHEAMQARREAMLTAFASDTFDARTLAPIERSPGANPGQGHAQFLAQLVPILRADQRTTLAAKMQAHEG